jgi:hypothetical protein
MTTELNATFTVENWDEEPFDEGDGEAKLTQAHVAKQYAGDIEGTSATEWVMAYADDGTAAFVGIERIRGSFGGKDGTLVLRHVGSFEDGAAVAALEVLSGTGAWSGVTGDGDFRAAPAGSVTLRLDGA